MLTNFWVLRVIPEALYGVFHNLVNPNLFLCMAYNISKLFTFTKAIITYKPFITYLKMLS